MDAEAIRELFEPSGGVSLKRMFGGHGIYRQSRIIAIEADGMIWLKVDAISRPLFETAGSKPFTYEKKGGAVTAMSYWLLPEAAFDDPDVMQKWVLVAEQAAARADAKSAARKPMKKPDKA